MSLRSLLSRLYSRPARSLRRVFSSRSRLEQLESRVLLTGTGLIHQLIGDVQMAPVNITLESPNAATAAGDVLYVGGSHSGQAAYQTVDLATGVASQVNLLDSLDTATTPTGKSSGAISEITRRDFGNHATRKRRYSDNRRKRERLDHCCGDYVGRFYLSSSGKFFATPGRNRV